MLTNLCFSNRIIFARLFTSLEALESLTETLDIFMGSDTLILTDLLAFAIESVRITIENVVGLPDFPGSPFITYFSRFNLLLVGVMASSTLNSVSFIKGSPSQTLIFQEMFSVRVALVFLYPLAFTSLIDIIILARKTAIA